jgi:Transposase
MAFTTTPAHGATVHAPVPASQGLAAIGVGIDTARYGHCVSFLRPDHQPAAKKLLVLENRASYQALRERLEQLHQQHPQAHFHIRIDAAGQYANNLERFLRGLPWPLTLSIGEPKRNRDYQKAHFPKRQTDETESIAMARFAVVEGPAATSAVPQEIVMLAEVAGRLQAQTKQATQAVNRLHNLLAPAWRLASASRQGCGEFAPDGKTLVSSSFDNRSQTMRTKPASNAAPEAGGLARSILRLGAGQLARGGGRKKNAFLNSP